MYTAAQINSTAIQLGIDPAYVLTPDDRMRIAGLMVDAYSASLQAQQVGILQVENLALKDIAVAQQGIETATASWEQKVPPLPSS